MTTARRRDRDIEVPSTVKKPDADPVLGELLGVAAPGRTRPVVAEPEPPQPEQPAATRPRMTVYISSDVQAALRAAVYWTRNEEHGFENLSDLLEAAALAKIKELEELYNGGKPFASLPKGKGLRRGRPIGRG